MTDDATPSPFDGMPDEFRRMLEQLTGPGGPLEALTGGGTPDLGGLQALGGLGGLAGLGPAGARRR